MKDSSEPISTVVETTDAGFELDVFERSRIVPVVVDFWADWCAPCRALGPVLEQLAAEYAGRFVLVKAETDRVPQAAAEFQVQGIPAVYGVVDGAVVDFFQGALPVAAVREWLERLLLLADVAEAQRLESSDPGAAEAKYRDLEPRLPNEPEVQIGLARALMAQRRADEARSVIEELERRGFLEAEAETIKAKLEIESLPAVDFDAARAAADANADDLPAQLTFAEALISRRQYEEALSRCLAVVEADRGAHRETARQLMVDVFRVAEDEGLVSEFRRKLATTLY